MAIATRKRSCDLLPGQLERSQPPKTKPQAKIPPPFPPKMLTSLPLFVQNLIYYLSNQLFNLIGNLLLKEWDKNLLGLTQLPIKLIIDIGANDGQFARKMIPYFPSARIYAFEPLDTPFQKLSRWAKRYAKRVSVFKLALGEMQETIELYSHLYFTPSSSILATTSLCETIYPMVKKQEKVTIRQSTLDQEMQWLGYPFDGDILIKLDVQGYEDRVIRGGKETFRQAKACIVEISLDQLYDKQASFRDIFYLLDDLGYSYAGNLDQVIAKDGHVRYFNAVFINQSPTY